MRGNKREDVYREALRLHKISWQRRTKAKYFWQKDTFDYSHLPKGFDSPSRWDMIDSKLNLFANADCWKDGRFNARLSFTDALILLLKPNFDNIHYIQDYDIDLANYKVRGNTFKIEII